MLAFIHLLQLEVDAKGLKGFLYVVVPALGTAIVAMAAYIMKIHKESYAKLDASHQEHLKNVQELMDSQVKRYEALTEKNTRALNENTTETRLLNKSLEDLSRLIRERLQ